jgi:hypothetical protein
MYYLFELIGIILYFSILPLLLIVSITPSIESFATIVLVIITSIYVYFTYNLAKQGQDNLAMQKKPIIGLTLHTYKYEPIYEAEPIDKLMPVEFKLTNISNVAAMNLKIYLNCPKIQDQQVGALQFISPNQKISVKNLIALLDNPKFNMIKHPNQEWADYHVSNIILNCSVYIVYENPYGNKYMVNYKRPDNETIGRMLSNLSFSYEIEHVKEIEKL